MNQHSYLDPQLNAQQLFGLANSRPDLWSLIVIHPNAYPELIEWISSQPSFAQSTPIPGLVETEFSEHYQSPAVAPMPWYPMAGQGAAVGGVKPKGSTKTILTIISAVGVVLLAAVCGVFAFNKLGTSSDTSSERSSATSLAMDGSRFIASGSGHSCAVSEDGQAYCWGDNRKGQGGDGSSGNKRVSPVKVGGELAGVKVTAISAGFGHTCAVSEDHQAYCWGGNLFDQVGDGSSGNKRVSPVKVGGELAGVKVTAISTGFGHTCAISEDHQVYCWGHNAHGELGDGFTQSRMTPVKVAGFLAA